MKRLEKKLIFGKRTTRHPKDGPHVRSSLFYGFCDCKCARFSAIEAHVNFCLTAYCLHHLLWDGQIAPKFTAADYLQMKNLQQAKQSLTQYGGKERVVALAAAELQRFKPAV